MFLYACFFSSLVLGRMFACSSLFFSFSFFIFYFAASACCCMLFNLHFAVLIFYRLDGAWMP